MKEEPENEMDVIDARITQNIIDKIASGGVPTERESRILKQATNERQQGRPSKIIRWTVEHAATEFGPDRRSLSKLLRDESIEPGNDGKYSTRDICKAIYENDSPRDAKDRQHTELLKVQTEIAKRERIPLEIVTTIWDAKIQVFVATLKAAKGTVLTAEKINEMIAAIRETQIPVIWK